MKQFENTIGFFDPIIQDDQMYPSHISLYVSLFQMWSINQFQNPFRINRGRIMESSKIKSLGTYHKCIKELDQAGFIIYSPSYDSYKGSLVEIIAPKQVEAIRSKKLRLEKNSDRKEHSFAAPKFYEVELYFNERDLPSKEADRFYSFYQSKNWSLYNNKLMTSWEAAARNWIYHLKTPVITSY